MNLNRQHKEILEALKKEGARGINSFYYRTHWIQLPVRIKELREKGYSIIVKHNKDRSVNYILAGSSKETPVYTPKPAMYNFVGNTAVRVEVEEPKQMEVGL